MAKGGNEPTKTTTAVLSPEQQEILKLAIPGVKQFAAQVPERYPGSGVAPFDPSQVAGQNMALNAAGKQAEVAGSAADANMFFTGGNIWDPAANSHLRGAIDAAVRPVTQAYQETVLPGIRNDAVSSGNFGSSKAGVTEGIAARGYTDKVGDTASDIVQKQYQTNIDAQLKAMGLAPTVQGTLTTPGITTSGVGDVRQNLTRQQLSEQMGNFQYDQYAPFLQSQDLISLLSGIPGGSSVSTGNVPQQNKALQALGGAASGASLGSVLGPMGTAGGAALGGLLPFLF